MAKAKGTTTRRRKPAAEPSSRGLLPEQMAAEPPASLDALRAQVQADGGRVLACYRDPVGGHWQLLAALPLAAVQPTPYQRDLSDTHVKRLTDVIDKLDRFLDPVVVVRGEQGGYWTPNGNHRRAALHKLGARAITALVVPERELAFRILALNTEKAHNLREKSLEVVRMARALCALEPGPETDYALQFEEPALVTLGLCYEQRGRFAGGQYHPVLRRVDGFMPRKLPAALELREARAKQLLELDDAVAAAVEALKARGLESPYLKAFVVARVNPIRFVKPDAAKKPDYEETFAKMLAAAKKFDAGKVKADQVARSGGPPGEE
jgi:ParB family chromosome partitioning protein